MKYFFGCVVGIIGMFILMVMGFAMLWCHEISKWNGMAGFIDASYSGHLIVPPAFWLVVLFYNNYFWMFILFLLSGGLLLWLGRKMVDFHV